MKAKCVLSVAVLAVLAVILSLVALNVSSNTPAQAADLTMPTRQGAWLDSMVLTEQGDASQAVAQLQADELDLYAYTVFDSALFQTVLEDSDLAHTESYGSYTELTFNPAGPTFYDGRLNPFSNAKIREAMNWLIDRDKIAQEIYKGLATPLYTSILPIAADFERFNTTIDNLESTYAYNFAQAQATITTEMVNMGATLQDGKWSYNGEPVKVIFIIRVEDERRPIGNYVADQLEAIGFKVDRQYKTRSEASPIWNQSDPAEGQWYIYTGGWIATNINRDNATNFGYFYTPLGSGSPLWQAYNPTPEFLELCSKLYYTNYSTVEERAALFEQALTMAMNDSGDGAVGSGSLRVWLVDVHTFAPRRAGTILSSDLASGVPGAAMFPYVARFDGVEGGDLRVAQPSLLIDPWNPVSGSTWSYDQFAIRATSDQATLVDPFTGLPQAQRVESADCVVKEGLPVTQTLDWVSLSFAPIIAVPEDAWVDWDATSQTFIAAGDVPTPTLQANLKCTITYPADLFTSVTWHDGSPLTIGDFILRMILQFDRAKTDSLIYDEFAVPYFESFMSHFRGVKIESTDPLMITTYDDQYMLDVEMIASGMTWWPTYNTGQAAWHALTPAIRAEQAGELAFSWDKAYQIGVEWTNFIGGGSLNILMNWMNQSAIEGYLPYAPTMASYVPPEEITARWAALQAWYTAYNHFWVGSGPFYLEQVSYDPKSVTLAHFDGFPDLAGKWDAFAAPAQPVMEINHSSGAPGSYFNFSTTGLPPDSNAFITVNGELLGELPVDSSGAITFTLSTDQAYPGVYHVRVSVNPSAGVAFTIDPSEPVWPREGEFPIITLPRRGAWLDSLVFSEQADPNQAVGQLQADELDLFAYPGIDPALFQTVMEDPDLTKTESFGNVYELTFNPSGPTFNDDRLNPFSNAKIREAMNWLVDRDKIAQEIYGGLAVPKFTSVQLGGVDSDRFHSTIEAIEATYAYSMTQAQTAITDEMLNMGATLEDGTWVYDGEPVIVIFLIRVEDQRLPTGDYVADQLEAIGFKVDRQYKTREEASLIWLQSDPAEGQWHIYTGGWIDTGISRDDATNFGFFYTPLGSGGTGDQLWPAYNPTPEFKDLCDKLWGYNFSTLGERAELFEQALILAISDSGGGAVGSGSLRIWLVNQQFFAPSQAGITVASDLVGKWATITNAGVASADLFPYVARFDAMDGGSLRIAQPGLLVEPWNPIAGSGWIYDQFTMRATADQATLSDPITGLPLAQRIERADCVVREGLPVTQTLDWVSLSFTPTIAVPEDAWADWDATSQTFIAAGDVPTPTLQANVKCTITYPMDLFESVTWHDGTALSMGDFILRMILQFDRAKPDSPVYDEFTVPNFEAFMSHFRGVKIESINPLVITTYDDNYGLDIELLASQMTWWPGSSLGQAAWHALTPALRAEEAGELAFSRDKADQLGVEWTNFIGGGSLDILETWMIQSAGENYIPYAPTMDQYVSPEEATGRWAALQTWYTAYNHFWLGSGPFYLAQVSYDPKSLTLAHFDGFADNAGKWDAFAAPAQPSIIINHSSGAPGSYFNVSGKGFTPDSMAFITVNGILLGELPVDSSGAITFTLSTEQANPGSYHLRVSVNPSAGLQFTLDATQPTWPREGAFPIIDVPGGMATQIILMPLVNKD